VTLTRTQFLGLGLEVGSPVVVGPAPGAPSVVAASRAPSVAIA
jgi:hypothetical protein